MKKNYKKIFVWNSSAVTNAIIDTLQNSSNVDVYYANSRLKVLSAKPILLKNDGSKMITEMKELGIEYVFSDHEANGKGLIDIAKKQGFKTIGADYKALKLESSKIFSKSLMKKYNINTADYIVIEDKKDLENIKDITFPVIIKADGYAKSLSAKKIDNYEELKELAEKYLNGYFGISSKKIIIEKYIDGIEYSIPLVLDGKIIKPLITVKDYKKRNNNNLGPNTGGMGSFAPIKTKFENKVLLNDLIPKLEKLLTKETLFYKGFMTINVIFSNNQLYLLEINTRLGDSEGQVLLKLIDFNFADLFSAIWEEKLCNFDFKWKKGYAIAINIINNDYPNIEKHRIASISKKSINEILKDGISIYFYNYTRELNNKFINAGDRFISLVKFGNSAKGIKESVYKSISKLKSKNTFYREDIGI